MTAPMKASRLLAGVTLGTGAFGALLLLAPGLTRQGFSLLMFGHADRIDGFDAEARDYITLLHGVLGAVLVGWSVALRGLSKALGSPPPPVIWPWLAGSVGTWFLVDPAAARVSYAVKSALVRRRQRRARARARDRIGGARAAVVGGRGGGWCSGRKLCGSIGGRARGFRLSSRLTRSPATGALATHSCRIKLVCTRRRGRPPLGPGGYDPGCRTKPLPQATPPLRGRA